MNRRLAVGPWRQCQIPGRCRCLRRGLPGSADTLEADGAELQLRLFGDAADRADGQVVRRVALGVKISPMKGHEYHAALYAVAEPGRQLHGAAPARYLHQIAFL